MGISSVDDPLEIDDVVMVKHYASGAFCEFDDDALIKFQDDCSVAGIDGDRCRRVWIHTHPGDSAIPSKTDEDILDEHFENVDWAVMAIFARNGNYTFRLRVSTHELVHGGANPQALIKVDTQLEPYIRYHGDQKKAYCNLTTCDPELLATLPIKEWVEEWKDKCRPMSEKYKNGHTPYYQGYSGGGGANQQMGFHGGAVYDQDGPVAIHGRGGSGSYHHPNADLGGHAGAAGGGDSTNVLVDPPPAIPHGCNYTKEELCEEYLSEVIDEDEKRRSVAFTGLVVDFGGDRQQALAWWRWMERRMLIRAWNATILPGKKQAPHTDLKQWPGNEVTGVFSIMKAFNGNKSSPMEAKTIMWDDIASRYELTKMQLDDLKAMKSTWEVGKELLEYEHLFMVMSYPSLFTPEVEVELAGNGSMKQVISQDLQQGYGELD